MKIEDGRHDVHESNDGSDPGVSLPWHANDQGDTQNALVNEDAVIPLAVLAERLAVIAGYHHDGSVEQPTAPEIVEQPADLRIRKCDFGDVLIGVPRPVRFGRIVGAMRIVQMRPQEEPGLTGAIQPSHRVRDDGIRATLQRPFMSLFSTLNASIRLEALSETTVGVQDDRANERTGPESALAQDLCERGVAACERC